MPGLLFPTRLFMPAAERATAWPRRVAGPSLLRRQERGATDVRHHVLELALDLAMQRLVVGLLFGEGFAYTVRRKSASCSFEEELKNGRCVWRASANRAVCWAVCCRLGRGALVMPT